MNVEAAATPKVVGGVGWYARVHPTTRSRTLSVSSPDCRRGRRKPVTMSCVSRPAARAVSAARGKVEGELAGCEHLAEELAARLGRGEITLARYDKAVEPLDRRIGELRQRLAELDAQPDADVPADVVAASREEWAQRWDAATTAERRTLLRQALRGQRLLVQPADPRNRTDVGARVVVEKMAG